ncbi:MAG: hypothetical protein AB7C96_12865 [Hydrogenovibrio sp.]
MTKRNLYLNVTFAVLFSVMMVTSTLHGNYGTKFLLIWVSFGGILIFTVYKVSKSYLEQSQKEIITKTKESSALVKFAKIIAASYAMAFGLSFLAFIVLLLPIGLEQISTYMENHIKVHMAVGTLICLPVVLKYLKR